jgi:large subunit ribosomal protein L35
MPKMKTDKGAAKRVKRTGTGRLRRRQAFTNHLLEHKSPKRKRRLARERDFASGDERQVKRMLAG